MSDKYFIDDRNIMSKEVKSMSKEQLENEIRKFENQKKKKKV